MVELLNKLKVSRRFALRGALGGIGVAMWLPVLDAMCNNNGTAFAAGDALPTSFGVWFWGNGVHADLWTPKATGNGDAWQLPTNLQDFAEVKDAMTLVTGLEMLDGKFKGHGWGVAYVLAGGDGKVISSIDQITLVAETSASTQQQMTIDQVVADALEKQAPSPIKSLETGMIPFSGDVNMGTVGDNLAHRGKSNFLSPKRTPKDVFDKLFKDYTPTTPGGGGGTGGSATGVPSDISFRTRRSVLDAVLEDCNRLKGTLGKADFDRVQSHMDGIRSIESRLPADNGSGGSSGTGNGTGGTGSTTVTCTKPAVPETIAEMTARSQAINKLIVLGLSCNLTRVYSHLWSGPRSDSSYPSININGEHHAYTHGTDGQEPRTIEKYIMSQYADLAKQMKATPMGAGNVLDHTIIYGISEQGTDPKAHLMKDYHIVLMGHGGGKVPGNRHVRLTGRKVTELCLTLQQVVGTGATSWGSWDQTSKTVPEILAT